MENNKPYIAVIGPNKDKCTKATYGFALKLGKQLGNYEINLVNGGKLGIMEAVFRGAKSNKNCNSINIGIIQEEEKKLANEYCDIIIPTGIGTARNKIIINTADIVIAIAGGAGTLSEMAFAWQMGKPIIAYSGAGGWAKELAGKSIDNQSDKAILEAKNIDEIIDIVEDSIKKFPEK